MRARADVGFVEADVYDAVQALGVERFDLVYTGLGALCWILASAAGPMLSQACSGPVEGC